MKRKLLSSIVILLIACPVIMAQEMLLNPGFESWTGGVPDSWQVESAVNVASEEDTVHSGVFSVALEATSSSNRGIYQLVPVTEGTTYVFSVFIYAENGTNDLGIYVNWLDSGGGVISGEGTFYNSASGEWENVTSGDITAPAGAVTARCRIRCYANSMLGGYADDASFMISGSGPTPTPGPPTSTPTATPTGPTPTPTPFESLAIYDIQYTTDPSGDSPYADQTVTTTGIVTAVEAGNYNVFIQDGSGSWNGIMIYHPPIDVQLGDEVLVTGTVQEFYGWTEISPVTTCTVLSSGNPLPEPIVLETVDISDEQWEGVLIQVEDVSVTNPDLGYGEFEIDDGSGPARVDDIFDFTYSPQMGDNLLFVRGPCYYSYSTYKILPRTDDDILVAGQNTPTPTPTGPTPTFTPTPPPTATPTGPTPTPPPIPQIKINEIYPNPPVNPDEHCFVELYYPGGISLDGFELVGVNGNGGADYNVISLDGYSIPADGYFVIAQDSGVANADLIDAAADYQNGPDSIQLRMGTTVVDAIGYGDFDPDDVFAGEGDPAPRFFQGEHSHSRIPDGADTDNNYADFHSGELTPGEMNIPENPSPTDTPTTGPTATPTGPTPTPPPVYPLIINEIHVNPDNQDLGCFVELYYTGTRRISLDGYKLVGVNGYDGSDYNSISLTGEIEPGGYFVIAQDGSVANADMVDEMVNYQNGPDNIQLRTGTEVVDAVGYGTFGADDHFAGEGNPADYPNPTGNKSLSRLPDATDTNDNAADFHPGELTPGEANIAAGEATPTPAPPTYTPVENTATPAPPTATPTSGCTELGVTINMPAESFAPGDTFYCDITVCNPGPDTYSDIPLFMILDVYGVYYFAPSFTTDLDYYPFVTLEPGEQKVQVLEPFEWPQAGEGAAIWYSAMTNPEITELLGIMDQKNFDWHE